MFDETTKIVNMKRMKTKETDIIDAAMRVFSRFGIKRATMNDIAGEVGVARQTLYASFSTKDDILRATIRLAAERNIAAINTECETAQTLGEKLHIFFTHHAIRPFEKIKASAEPEDLLSGFNAAGEKEIEKSNAAYCAALERILKPYEAQLAETGLTLRGLAELIQVSSAGFKQSAKSKKQLMRLHDALKASVLATLGES